jgi:hypothetical protein
LPAACQRFGPSLTTVSGRIFGLFEVKLSKLSEQLPKPGKGRGTRTVVTPPQRMYWVVMANILGSKLKVPAPLFLCARLSVRKLRMRARVWAPENAPPPAYGCGGR